MEINENTENQYKQWKSIKNNKKQRKSIKITTGICWDIQACAMVAYASKGHTL